MQTRIITVDDPEWQLCLERLPHDIYHKAEYVRLCANQDGGAPLAFVASEGENLFFVPLLLSPFSSIGNAVEEHYDALCPYGYPSPLSNCLAANFWQQALEELIARLRDGGVVSVFLRLHPILAVQLEALRQVGAAVHHGETVFFDLTRPEDELWKETRQTARQQINRALRNGFTVQFDDEWQHLDEFMEIYWESMKRLAASDEYLFPPEYFYELKDSLNESVHLAWVISNDGQLACGMINTEVDGIVQAHLTGMRSEFLKHQPLKVLIDGVRRWAAARGNRYFHLGGGVGGKNDSLFDFKSGFAKGRGDFYTWRAIVNEGVYRTLASEWAQQSGNEADGVEGFFPAYRRKLPQTV